MNGFPNKRDFYYIVGFLVALLIFVIAGRLADNTEVVAYVGFAGTIVSILLAVIAIIYSFYQSSTYENANSKLDNSANKIQEATTKLSNVSEIESMMREFKKEVISLKGSMEDLKSSVGRVDDGVSSMKVSFERGFQFTPNTENEFQMTYQKDYLEKFVGNSSKISLFFLLLARNYSNANKPVNLIEWTTKYCEFVLGTDSPDKSTITQYMFTGFGMMAVCTQMKLFSWENKKNGNVLVLNFNATLNEVIQNQEDIITQNNEHELYALLKEIKSSI
ncbi:hypothetical protein [Bacillus cereus]|uniref:Uncharacterized protein n=1 Tax=Bacillus cereus TaxID=1396 RepID=A0AA44QBG2_BACCE|nr:hypothetical protein [Bacillus cereus]PFN09331.1 hypothetical protein COJ55_03480 [Bacillus cereus]PFS02024.1 hypothetical protein COK38_10110 [Bacillus cereus]